MRRVHLTIECAKYVEVHSKEIEKKFKYSVQILSEQKVIHTKLAKKLIDTEFYELRISVGNEHRIILLATDNPNLIESQKVVLLNGFVKKNKKDYKKVIEIARKLVKKYKIIDDE
ncbi:MAG: type II toxin-antitoxin system RelE/ParE family toxin [Saprospiraceae bacterium]